MARRRSIEAALEALAELRRDWPGDERAIAELRAALAGSRSLEAQAAARVVEAHGLLELEGDLCDAFARFLAGASPDKGCLAKTAIARALHEIDARADDVFLAGIRHRQLEPVFGGKADVAAELRGVCAFGLARSGHGDTLDRLAELLADPEAEARAQAARAIPRAGMLAGGALLRLRIAIGDDVAVMGECFAALLALDPRGGRETVGGFLEAAGAGATGELAEAAALAIGESRVPGALELLRGWLERAIDAEERRVALVAISLLRSDEAIDHLMEIVREGRVATAAQAIAALEVFRTDAALRERLGEAVRARASQALAAKLEECFGTD